MKNRKIDNLEIITTILVFANIFLYEIGFCNLYDITQNHTYNFSLFRMIIYGAVILIHIKFSNRFIEKAENTLESKKKIIIIYLIFSFIVTVFQTITTTNVYTIILILLAIINGLIFILYITKDYIKNIIITILTFGFMFSISTNYYHSFDEKVHFLTALNISVGHLDLVNGITNEDFDKIEFSTSAKDFAMEYFSKKTDFKMGPITNTSIDAASSSPSNHNPIIYLPSTIGIWIARLLGGSIADIFIAGRITNLIVYGILLILIFKILPFKKDTFFTIYLLPMSVCLAATYSIDGIIIGIIGIFIAYILKLYKEAPEKITLKQFLILASSYMFVLLCKNGCYFAIGLLIFILPVKKYIKSNKKLLYMGILIAICAISLGLYQGVKLSTDENGDTREINTNPKAQVEYLIENPTHIIRVYVNYARYSLLNLHWYSNLNTYLLFGDYYSSVAIGLFILVLYIALADTSYTFDKKTKIISSLTFVIIYVITSFILYLAFTIVGKDYIRGYQARYLLPIFPIILMLINSKKINCSYKSERKYSGISMMIGIFSFINLLSMITTNFVNYTQILKYYLLL